MCPLAVEAACGPVAVVINAAHVWSQTVSPFPDTDVVPDCVCCCCCCWRILESLLCCWDGRGGAGCSGTISGCPADCPDTAVGGPRVPTTAPVVVPPLGPLIVTIVAARWPTAGSNENNTLMKKKEPFSWSYNREQKVGRCLCIERGREYSPWKDTHDLWFRKYGISCAVRIKAPIGCSQG